MGHDHGPRVVAGTVSAAYRRRLAAAISVTGVVLVVQLVGAVLSNSLALLSDSLHMFVDTSGVALALVAVTVAQREPTPQRTWGLYRVEILAALVNAMLLGAVGAFIAYQAVRRIGDPPDVRTGPLLAAALLGLAANLVGLFLLRGGKDHSLNLRGAYLEVLGDTMGSVAAVATGLVIAASGWTLVDPIASLVIVAMILPRAYLLLRDTLQVLLEATPRDLDLGALRTRLLEEPDIDGVHDLHAWTVTSGMPVLTAHLTVTDAVIREGRLGPVLDRVGTIVGDDFDVRHSTIQLEPAGHRAHEYADHP